MAEATGQTIKAGALAPWRVKDLPEAPPKGFKSMMKMIRYKTREQAIREITEYIEVFYNRQRRQARLGYLSPAVYERQFYAR